MRRIAFLVVIIATACAVGGCRKASPAAPAGEPEAAVPGEAAPGGEQAALPGEPVQGEPATTASGLQYYVLAPGSGEPPASGSLVSVHYSGYLLDGTKFDSSLDRGEPFRFYLGQGQVIPGWDEGVALMPPGAKYKFVIPPELGYGSAGVAEIPPNATLVFDVEMLADQ